MKEASNNGSPRPRGEGPGGRAAKQRGPYRDLGDGASTEAKRVAAVILEVLAGARTPPEAATVLKVSLPMTLFTLGPLAIWWYRPTRAAAAAREGER